MSKFVNRLAARVAMSKLRESAEEAKNWIVTKKLILEAEDEAGEPMDLELDAGDTVEIGADENGDLGVKTGAAVVVVSDPELAAKIADVVVSADELSDVNFVQKPALDAVLDGEDIDTTIDALADEEGTDVEVPEVEVEKKESVEAKFAKFAKNDIRAAHKLVCESIQVEDGEAKALNLYTIKADRVMKESFADYAKFAARVSEMKGSLQPGKREIALSESGKVIGSFDKAASAGTLFTEEEFDSVDAMDSFDDQPTDLMQEYNFGAEEVAKPDLSTLPEADKEKLDALMAELNVGEFTDAAMETADKVYNDALAAQETNPALATMMQEYGLPAVWYAWKGQTQSAPEVAEACLKKYEESAKTGADYMELVRGLRGLKESTVAEIVSTFNDHNLQECVRVFDSKYGKFVKAFKESSSADNFIVETGAEKRFTKRFFA